MTSTPLQRRFWACLQREDGFALVLALGISVVLAILGTTVTLYVSQNSSLASRSSADQDAFALAEAGVNDAMSVLSNPSNNALNPALLPNSLALANVSSYNDGVVKWWGSFDSTTTTWTLYSYGYERNPTGATASEVIRRISTTVKVRPSFMQPPNTVAWNYLVSLDTGTPGGCDLSLNNSMNIQAPLYVMGNLCLNTPSQISQGTADPMKLVVRGSVTLAVNTNIGASGTPIAEAHIGGGCSYKGGAYHTPCSATDRVWATVSDANPPPLTIPTANFSAWYQNAAPGPNQACTTSSGTVPVFDTGDGLANNSVTTILNPASGPDYSCVVSAGGQMVGQISWNSAQKKLTVYGTIYIDGSVCFCGDGTIQYVGQASLYLSGTFRVFNSNVCGAISGSSCAWSNPPSGWDPNSTMLMVVANGQGGQNPGGDSAQIKNSYWQGGLFTTSDIELDTTSQVEGPMLASTEIVGQSIQSHAWATITSVPAGAPSTPVVYSQPDPPADFRG